MRIFYVQSSRFCRYIPKATCICIFAPLSSRSETVPLPVFGSAIGGMIDFFSEGSSRLAPRFQPVSYVTSNYDIPGEVSFVPRHELQRVPFYEDL